jgi:hypothetical protein
MNDVEFRDAEALPTALNFQVCRQIFQRMATPRGL